MKMRQRFVALSGRVSMIVTASPTLAVSASSWAWYFLRRMITLP